MTLSEHNTLGKDERASGQVLTSQLFEGGHSKSMAMYPIRLVYMKTDLKEKEKKARILISVPKRMLHHAVDRNRVKRQIREAFRTNKHIINNKIAETDSEDLILAFIWTDHNLHSSEEVNGKVVKLLKRLEEKL